MSKTSWWEVNLGSQNFTGTDGVLAVFAPLTKQSCGFKSLDWVWPKTGNSYSVHVLNWASTIQRRSRALSFIRKAWKGLIILASDLKENRYKPLVDKCRWDTPAPWTARRSSSWYQTLRTRRWWNPTTAPHLTAGAPRDRKNPSEWKKDAWLV